MLEFHGKEAHAIWDFRVRNIGTQDMGVSFFESTLFGLVECETKRTPTILGGPYFETSPHMICLLKCLQKEESWI